MSSELGANEGGIIRRGGWGNLARKISLYLLRELTDISNEEIGGYFGIGYTAVSQAALRVKKELAKNRRLRKIVHNIEVKLSEE